MSEDTQRAWIENRLITQVAANQPAVALNITNVKFEIPTHQLYICYYILGGAGTQVEIVDRGYERHVGVLQVDVMAPENDGTGAQTRLADWVIKLFSRQKALLTDGAYLNFRVGSSTQLGNKEGVARRVCSIPYWRDEKPA